MTPPTLLVGMLLLTVQAVAFFILPCSRPVVVERADPIVNPGTLSPHAHTVMGGSGFDFTMDYDRARASACSTCKITADLSNYWIPNLYHLGENGEFTSVEQSGGMLIYYLQRSDPKDPEFEKGLIAFPKDFRMVAGNPMLRSFHDTLDQKAISYACLGVSGPETNDFPSHDCPGGLRLQVTFPSCWDGMNVDSSDHRSHVAYPDGVDHGSCPRSHPKRFITLFYEVTYQTNKFKDQWHGSDQPFVLSNGDPTGFGLHGDFVNGWEIDTLQAAITQCTDAGGSIERCGVLRFFDDETMNGCRVPAKVNEQVFGVLPALPGCNPVQYGPENAIPHKDCGAVTDISGPQLPFTDLAGSLKFRYVGCGRDPWGKPRTLDGANISKDDMTIEYCVEWCKAKGYKFAGLEYAKECWCGDGVADDRKPKNGILGTCELVCSGNNRQICGGYGAISLYERCSSGDCKNADLL